MKMNVLSKHLRLKTTQNILSKGKKMKIEELKVGEYILSFEDDVFYKSVITGINNKKYVEVHDLWCFEKSQNKALQLDENGDICPLNCIIEIIPKNFSMKNLQNLYPEYFI